MNDQKLHHQTEEEKFAQVVVKPMPSIGMNDVMEKLIIETLATVLEDIAPNAKRGTIILDGQSYDGEVDCLLRFNLREGEYPRSRCGKAGLDGSSDDAAESIDQMLNWLAGEESCYDQILGNEATGYAPDGWYKAGKLRVLILNSQNGRFYFSSFLHDEDEDIKPADNYPLDEIMGDALAYILARLYPTDIALREAAMNIQVESEKLKPRLERALQVANQHLAHKASPTVIGCAPMRRTTLANILEGVK